MNRVFHILKALKALNLLKNAPPLWWPSAGSFEVVVGAILTQRARFEKVQKSLDQLKNTEMLSLDPDRSLHNLSHISQEYLAKLITPSGFYQQKAHYLIALSQHILEDFKTFASFQAKVDREWLLVQKGIGFESADSILNYACLRPVLVVDTYTYRLLASLGVELEDYHAMQEFFMRGLQENLEATLALYNHQLDLASIYARLHGKIVECMRAKIDLKPYLKDEYDFY
ncbi:3-methyladenine DNA glycosylase [Helicobacter salomonis]|uniref:3-methyladenine DNA glycosylase n=1 Tax=Helicobacter salomonis TaxID=56878 RepID=UPI000CF094DF|nr:3-methyladenine DNA glycosylase [Helicobacter salomonis]